MEDTRLAASFAEPTAVPGFKAPKKNQRTGKSDTESDTASGATDVCIARHCRWSSLLATGAGNHFLAKIEVLLP
jgi:hypothetical protein